MNPFRNVARALDGPDPRITTFAIPEDEAIQLTMRMAPGEPEVLLAVTGNREWAQTVVHMFNSAFEELDAPAKFYAKGKGL